MKADELEQRLKNALIYGTSHPEVYMTKADELWEKYEKSDWYGDCVHRDGFLAALTEYGELVKAEAVKCVMTRYMGDLNREDLEVKRCAAAIEKMELP